MLCGSTPETAQHMPLSKRRHLYDDISGFTPRLLMFATCFACFILLFYFLWSGIVKNETKISKRRLIDDEINTQEMTDIEIQIHIMLNKILRYLT